MRISKTPENSMANNTNAKSDPFDDKASEPTGDRADDDQDNQCFQCHGVLPQIRSTPPVAPAIGAIEHQSCARVGGLRVHDGDVIGIDAFPIRQPISRTTAGVESANNVVPMRYSIPQAVVSHLRQTYMQNPILSNARSRGYSAKTKSAKHYNFNPPSG